MYRGSPFRSTWTWVTLGLSMCKVCTEAVHCVALCTRVTLGLGMCKICTEAVHCVSSPLQAFWRWSLLQTLFKLSFSAEGFKPPWSPLQAPLKPSSSPLKAFRRWSPFKPSWSPLQAPSKPPSPSEGFKPPSSPLEAPFKPPWSPLNPSFEAPFKPPSSLLQAPLKPLEASFTFGRLQAPFKPPWSLLEAPLKPPSSPFRRWSPLEAFRRWSPFKPSWRVPSKGASLKVKSPSSLKSALPEGPPGTFLAEAPDCCKPLAGLTSSGAWLASRLPVAQGANKLDTTRCMSCTNLGQVQNMDLRSENPFGALASHHGIADNRTWWILSSMSMSGSITWLQWNEVGFSRILLELSGSKAAANNHFSSIVGCCIVATTRTINGSPVLHSFIHWDVGEPTCFPGSTTGMLLDNHLLPLGVTWDIYSRELLCHREASTERYEDCIFWKRSVSLSVLGVFLCCVCLVCVCVWVRLWKTPGFLLLTCSRTTWEQLIDPRRFDDRPSLERVRHELKKLFSFGVVSVVFLFGLVFLSKLHASLQQWQSLNGALAWQRWQTERSGTVKTEYNLLWKTSGFLHFTCFLAIWEVDRLPGDHPDRDVELRNNLPKNSVGEFKQLDQLRTRWNKRKRTGAAIFSVEARKRYPQVQHVHFFFGWSSSTWLALCCVCIVADLCFVLPCKCMWALWTRLRVWLYGCTHTCQVGR